jgi:DNA-binding transcriptional MocR family regulator
MANRLLDWQNGPMPQSTNLADLGFRPNPTAPDPIYVQLAAVLSEAIRAGHIAVGARLPSERVYAKALGVSRTTVTSAYQELKVMGLLRGYVGRGAIVIADDPDRASAGAISWPQLASRHTVPIRAVNVVADSRVISFGDGWLHPSLIPHTALAACAARVAAEPDTLTKAAPLLGLPVLQEALIEMLGTSGVRATASEVLVTSGAQQGLNVVARALISPRDVIICENPTWYGAPQVFRAAGAEVIGVGMDHEGVDPDALEDAVVRLRPKFVYLIPSFHCPTGRLLGLQRRRRILEMCARLRTPIVESHVYGDIRFGDRVPSLKSLDTAGIVIHQGSASKTISPALRLGWLVAPRAALDALAPAKASLDLSTPATTQAVLAAFLKSSAYARHQVKFRDELRTRRDALIAALAEHCPDLRHARPEGGLYLWAQLPNRLQAQEFHAAAAAEGVSVRSGDSFLTNGGTSSHIRLCFAAPALGEVAAGAERLGKALRAALQRHRRSAAADSAFAPV